MSKPKVISNSSVQAIFTDHFKGRKNLMTPEAFKHGVIPRYLDRQLVWELSRGEGFDHETIFGVTVLEVNSIGYVRRVCRDFSRGGFRTEAEAKAYIQSLKKVDLGRVTGDVDE